MGKRVARALDLADLAVERHAMTKAVGEVLCEAGAICLDHNKHLSPVDATFLSGIGSATLVWPAVTDAMRRCHNDLQEATERGASGVAIALVRQKLRLEVVERARKRSGVDYWLGSGKQLFQKSARLEVSGILRGDATQVRSRVKEKHSQTKQSDQTRLPAIVVVVEFGAPMIAFEERLGR